MSLSKLCEDYFSAVMPASLRKKLGEQMECFKIKHLIIDISTSLCAADGHEIKTRRGSICDSELPFTRWDEMRADITKLVKFFQTIALDVPVYLSSSVYRLSNYKALLKLLDSSTIPPASPDITKTISAVADEILANGQAGSASVIIFSDSTDFYGLHYTIVNCADALGCPVVLRLCTDDKATVKRWNQTKLDNLTILDDHRAEAVEIRENNKWLVYGEGLHLMRVLGSSIAVLGKLDSERLTNDEIWEFIQLLYGPECTSVAKVKELQVFGCRSLDPIDGSSSPWIKTDQLQSLLARFWSFLGFGI